MKQIWMMRFVRASERDKPGAGMVAVTADCEEADLQGEKEAAAMRLEENTGTPWVCLDAVPLAPGRRHESKGT